MPERPKQPRLTALAALSTAAVAIAGCGSGGTKSATKRAAGENKPESTDESTQTGFSVAPTMPGAALGLPAGWAGLRLPSGATLPYPTTWRPIHGDPGTASAALVNTDGTIRAYLNATPADEQERPATWARFRVHHNAEEGDRDVRLIASQSNTTLGGSSGACVIDSYRTPRTTYRERACVVRSRSGGRWTVLVAAAQPAAWASERHTFEFAFQHFRS